MKVSVTGDFAKLKKIAQQVKALGGPQAMLELNKLLAHETLDLIAEGFRNETDPYGKPWARKAIPDGRAILVGTTARLRRSWHVRSTSSTGFTVATSVNYARYHQSGTGLYGPSGQRIRPKRARALAFRAGGKTIVTRSVAGAPQRLMVPHKNALPLYWAKRLRETADEYLIERFR